MSLCLCLVYGNGFIDHPGNSVGRKAINLSQIFLIAHLTGETLPQSYTEQRRFRFRHSRQHLRHRAAHPPIMLCSSMVTIKRAVRERFFIKLISKGCKKGRLWREALTPKAFNFSRTLTMTIKFVGASGKNGREREVIPVPEGATDVKAVTELFQCDRRTAKASRERGYYIVNYHRRTVCPGDLDTDAAYRPAWLIYRRKFLDRLPWYMAPEDLVQEGVLRLLEMAGHPRFQGKGFRFYLALSGMKGFIERQRRLRGGINGTTSGYDETHRPDAWSSWQRAWQAKRDTVPDQTQAGPCNRPRLPESMAMIVRQIFRAGEGISQAGLGRHLGLSPRGAGRKVAHALEAGMGEKVCSTSDCRRRVIQLSAKGSTLLGAAL